MTNNLASSKSCVSSDTRRAICFSSKFQDGGFGVANWSGRLTGLGGGENLLSGLRADIPGKVADVLSLLYCWHKSRSVFSALKEVDEAQIKSSMCESHHSVSSFCCLKLQKEVWVFDFFLGCDRRRCQRRFELCSGSCVHASVDIYEARVRAHYHQHTGHQRVKVHEKNWSAQMECRVHASVDMRQGLAKNDERAKHVVQGAAQKRFQKAQGRAGEDHMRRRKYAPQTKLYVQGQVRAHERCLAHDLGARKDTPEQINNQLHDCP